MGTRRRFYRRLAAAVLCVAVMWLVGAELAYRTLLSRLPVRPCPFTSTGQFGEAPDEARAALRPIYPWSAYRLAQREGQLLRVFAKAFVGRLRASGRLRSIWPDEALELAAVVWISRHWTVRDLEVGWWCGFGLPAVIHESCTWDWPEGPCASAQL